MHPSFVLAFWLLAVLLIQVLPAPWLSGASLVVLLVSEQPVRVSFMFLLRRSRWILLTLLLTFIFLTPGERLLPGFPGSLEGLHAAGEQLLRLLAVLLAVAWLVAGRPVEWLLSALWGGLALARGDAGRRFIVRLALTLRYAAGDERRSSWRALLAASVGGSAASDGRREITLAHVPLPASEKAVVATVLLLALIWIFVA